MWESDRGIDGTPGMRAGNLVIGLLLTAVAIAIALLGELSTSIGSLLATLVLGGLGVDALVSAVRRRRSLLSRIGPLP
jgi:hypothetical protein